MQQQEAGGADLQQVRAKEEEEEEEEEEGLAMVFAVWDCGSPLYDSFELASLHHVLESHLMVLPFSGAATSWSRRLEHRGGGATAPPDVTDRAAARRRRRVGRRRGWRGSKTAATIFRAVTCWRNL
jgi:hypothetical protein